jgi:hypothetical protein
LNSELPIPWWCKLLYYLFTWLLKVDGILMMSNTIKKCLCLSLNFKEIDILYCMLKINALIMKLLRCWSRRNRFKHIFNVNDQFTINWIYFNENVPVVVSEVRRQSVAVDEERRDGADHDDRLHPGPPAAAEPAPDDDDDPLRPRSSPPVIISSANSFKQTSSVSRSVHQIDENVRFSSRHISPQ